jgi:hypothetical protein
MLSCVKMVKCYGEISRFEELHVELLMRSTNITLS